MATGVRRKRHEEFAADQIPIMVATSAFGMGIDKANIRWVTHMALPDSPDSYLQEIGRAGRDGAPARVLLLFRPEDMALQRFFNGGSPAIDELLFVAAAVHAGVRTKAEIATKTSLPARKVAALLNLLETIGAAVLGGRGEVRCPPFAPTPEDAAVLAAAEHDRHQLLQRSRTDMMRQFAETDGCRVQPLLNYFGEQLPRRCGHCDNCSGAKREAAPRRAGQPFALHTVVRHAEWGRGTVLGYERDRMTVLFDDAGYKTLSVDLVRDNGLLAAETRGGDA
jgi:ATP-dependent DNA helicase RecQ